MSNFLNLAWLIPIPTFVAFLLIVLFFNKYKRLSSLTAIVGAAIALILGWGAAFAAFLTPHFGAHPFYGTLYTIPTGLTDIVIGWQVDPANALMLFMVCFLLLMIFIYASGYMTFPGHLRKEQYPEAYAQQKDPRYSRFMAYISLFATGMLGLVISNNLITFFVFWEIMGLCSYLLIGFWYEKESARKASFKAFMTTRIGDAIMLIGMLLLYSWSNPPSLDFQTVLSLENLEHLAHMTVNIPLVNTDIAAIAVVSFLIFWGTIGKSAQFPLHVWLPDAMEGPTPVSAMIHAATMVSAGVFLLVRMFPMFAVAGETVPGVMGFVAFIGAFTALFAATIAIAQWDIKRVLAYSTISQLGFMVAAIGIGAYGAALFHLIAHAFFKALLFLGSGSVIHGVEHGSHLAHEGHGHDDHAHDAHDSHGEHGHDDHGHDEHGHAVAAPVYIERPDGKLNPDDPQDMRNMGGLLRRMPITGITFIIGALSLSGFPLITAGFWSKDEILASANEAESYIVLAVLALAALLTAFYTTRQVMLTFFGKPRTAASEHAPESVPSMTIPLILISPFALGLGWLGIPNDFPVLGNIGNWLEGHLEPYIEAMGVHVVHPHFNVTPLGLSLVVALGGILLGWFVYGRKAYKYEQIDPMRRLLGPVWTLLHNKYYIDELYGATIIPFTMWLTKILYWFDAKWVIDPIVNGIGRFNLWLSALLAAFDKYVIDGLVNFSGWISERTGAMLRNTQNGHVQVYLLVLVLTVTVWLLLQALPVILTLV